VLRPDEFTSHHTTGSSRSSSSCTLTSPVDTHTCLLLCQAGVIYFLRLATALMAASSKSAPVVIARPLCSRICRAAFTFVPRKYVKINYTSLPITLTDAVKTACQIYNSNNTVTSYIISSSKFFNVTD